MSKYTEVHTRLQALVNKLPEHSCADIRFVRGLAFGRANRKLMYHELLLELAPIFALHAITERLKA